MKIHYHRVLADHTIKDSKNRPSMNKKSLSEAMRNAYHDFNVVFQKLVYLYAFLVNVNIMTI